VSEANGVIVSPCYVLTNHHVLFGDESKPSDQVREVYVYIGRGKVAFKSRLHGMAVNRSRETEGDREDYALVFVPICPGKVVGWVETKALTAQALSKEKFTLAAIPASSAEGKIELQACIGKGIEGGSGRVLTSCVTKPGHSGGAILMYGLGEIGLVALHQGATDTRVARALPMAQILSDGSISDLLREDKRKFLAEHSQR
jgi:hypothetical protein